MGNRTKFFVSTLVVMALGRVCFGDDPPQASQTSTQPTSCSVSDFGTSFTFSVPPICAGSIEAEIGFLSLGDTRLLPAVITVAPFKSKTDFTVLVNLLDSEAPAHNRTIHFGDRFDFVVRQQIFEKSGLVLTVAPRGAFFTGGFHGGRVGAAFGIQYSKGNNLCVANFTFTRAIDSSSLNPRTDYQVAFDYYRTLNKKGVAVFVGFQHETSTGTLRTISTEQGLVLPFRNGQVELAMEQLNLNTKPVWQFQARVILTGKLLHK